MPVVRDFESCRLALEDPGDPATGLSPSRLCSWTGQTCGPTRADGPEVSLCPRFEDVSRAPCPVCAAQGRQSCLRHDPEYNLYAYANCPEAWYLGQRELFAAYAETLSVLAREIAGPDAPPPSHGGHAPENTPRAPRPPRRTS